MQAFAELMKADGLDTMDRTSISAVLWLGDDPERLKVLRELREAMTPGQRSRLNSPITARQRVEAILQARRSGNEETVSASPVALLKHQIVEQAREIANCKLAKRRKARCSISLRQRRRHHQRHHRRPLRTRPEPRRRHPRAAEGRRNRRGGAVMKSWHAFAFSSSPPSRCIS